MMDGTIDVIIFSLSKFDDPISSVGFSYAKEFAKKQRVFFIEHPYTWKDYFSLRKHPQTLKREKLWASGNKYHSDPSIPSGINYIVPPRMIPVNFLPAGAAYDSLSALNDKKMFRMLEELIRENDIKNFVFYSVFNPFYMIDFPPHIKPLYRAYLSLDDMSQVEYTARHGVRRESELLRKWEMAFATGKELQKIKSAFNPNTEYLPNASDFSLFRKAFETVLEKPEELRMLEGRKIIGFTGSVEYRSDFELLKKMVEKHRDKVFVVVGPINTDEVDKMGFRQMENVVFTGPKPITELPAYLQYMDVMIIPYRLITVTKSIYPLKINEYLGAGKPVVATHFSEDIFSFRDVIYIAESHDEFIDLIDVAIAEDSMEKKQARVQVASENSWTQRVEHFWNCARKQGFL
jgi:teichuronic acid biosynthesis glycosyltransferase TuaH